MRGLMRVRGCCPVQAVPSQGRSADVPATGIALTLNPPQVVLEGGWHNRVALPVLNALGAAVMRTWNSSLPLWQYHHSYQWPVRARRCRALAAPACLCVLWSCNAMPTQALFSWAICS